MRIDSVRAHVAPSLVWFEMAPLSAVSADGEV